MPSTLVDLQASNIADDDDVPDLVVDDSLAEKFHSLAYKILYLAKRCRPDILPAAQFLTTRVTISTDQDMEKAYHALKYMNNTRTLELRLGALKPLAILCYIDAAHAVHPDKKSQSGSCIGLGIGNVHWSTAGVKMNTKSTTETEFYSTGENITDAIFIRNYLIAQGYDIPPVTVYQDNQAAIKLCENGVNSSARTRHIDIRYFFIKDRIDNGDIKVEYLHTKSMIADYLTKPLVGELFYKLRDLLLGYTTL